MFLKLDETTVTPQGPQGLQLFDHAVAGVRLIACGHAGANEPNPSRRLSVRVTLGTVTKPEAVTVNTRRFPLSSITAYEAVYQRWQMLRGQLGSTYQESYIDALLKCVWHFDRLNIEFCLHRGRMRSLLVHLGDFKVRGRFPNGFDLNQYFGESSKLVDAT